jgi:hypothetical protein
LAIELARVSTGDKRGILWAARAGCQTANKLRIAGTYACRTEPKDIAFPDACSRRRLFAAKGTRAAKQESKPEGKP